MGSREGPMGSTGPHYRGPLAPPRGVLLEGADLSSVFWRALGPPADPQTGPGVPGGDPWALRYPNHPLSTIDDFINRKRPTIYERLIWVWEFNYAMRSPRAAKFNRAWPLWPSHVALEGLPGREKSWKNWIWTKFWFNPMSSTLNCILNPILASKPTQNHPKCKKWRNIKKSKNFQKNKSKFDF